MADTLVLAELSIDSRGVISGMAAVDKSLDQGTRRLNTFGNEGEKTAKKTDLLGARLFNLKNAVSAALGGVTLAGGILAIKNLGEQALRAQENFAVFDKALGRAQTSVFRLLGDLTGINKSLGDTAVILDAVARSVERLRGGAGGGGSLLMALWGTTDIAQVQRLLSMHAAIIKMLDPKYGTGGAPSTAKPWEKLGTLNVPTAPGAKYSPPGFIGPPGPQGYGDPRAPYIPQAIKIDVPPNLADPIRGFGNAIDNALISARNLGGYLGSGRSGLQENGETLPSIFEAFGEIYVEDVTGQFDEMAAGVDRASDAFANFQTIAIPAMEAVSAAAAAGVISATAAARFQEALLAVDAILRGKIQVAHAVAAAASGNYGAAALHGVAAGLYFSAAAFHGVAAVSSGAYGGGGGAGGRTPNQPGLLQQGQSSPGSPNVTVIVQGSLLGTSKDQLARDIVTLWEKGAKDQGGGNAVVARAT
jgi:hypothetical protein